MADLQQQLVDLRPGKPKKIKGRTVTKDGESYVIDGDTFTLEDAITRLEEPITQKSGMDYDTVAFFEREPYSTTIVKVHRVKSKSEHSELVEEVKKRKHYLWYGRVVQDGKKFSVSPPLVIDFETVPDVAYSVQATSPAVPKTIKPEEWDGGLSCPFCSVTVQSTPGRTLHVKHQHPDKLQDYFSLLSKTISKPVVLPKVDDEDDVVSRVAESESSDELKCPFCNHKVNSTPGRTNHVKGKHPERIEEYRKIFG
jgi:hypothetical protein